MVTFSIHNCTDIDALAAKVAFYVAINPLMTRPDNRPKPFMRHPDRSIQKTEESFRPPN